MTRAFRWLAAVAGTLAMISPPVWVVALTATVATAIILARTSAYLRRRREDRLGQVRSLPVVCNDADVLQDDGCVEEGALVLRLLAEREALAQAQ